MDLGERAMSSVYLEWAKLESAARYNLATSGMMSYPLAGLPVSIADLEINGPTLYGYEPLQERLARKCGVAPENVVAATGTSGANFLAMAAVVEPGDDVLVEWPAYGILLEVASHLGANILRFERRFEDGFQIDPDQVRAKITAKTRLIVLTNLHNPSGAYTSEETLRELGAIAATVGARVLVDEVYLDMVPEKLLGWPARSSFHLGDNFLVTNSLTKAYGLSGIRCGWILADAELARRIWRLSDLVYGTPVHVGELLSAIALDNLPRIHERARRLLAVNRIALDKFLDSRSGLEVLRPIGGTVIFPRLGTGSVEKFSALLREKYETSVVPGRYFEMADHFRVGIGGDGAMTAEGLGRLGAALEEFGAC